MPKTKSVIIFVPVFVVGLPMYAPTNNFLLMLHECMYDGRLFFFFFLCAFSVHFIEYNSFEWLKRPSEQMTMCILTCTSHFFRSTRPKIIIKLALWYSIQAQTTRATTTTINYMTYGLIVSHKLSEKERSKKKKCSKKETVEIGALSALPPPNRNGCDKSFVM